MKQKHWQVSVFDKTSELIKNDAFYTTDSEAYLVFELLDEYFTPDSATVTVYNTHGKVTIHVTRLEVVDGIVRYELPVEAIRYSGDWRTQVVFTKDGEDYTTKVVEFAVGGHLLGNKKTPTVLIENWNSFIRHARDLIDDWGQLEKIRQANEEQRELAEFARQNEFETNETSRQANELVREEAENNRQSTFESNETERQNEFETNENERESAFEERYEQVEEKYAPQLTELKQNDENLTAQLAEIVIYVDDFGAVGDGVTDDTQSIQEALDYASDIGATVKFKKELYMIDAVTSLKIPSNSVVDFTNTTIKALPNSEHRYNVVNVSNVENVHLINPTIVGDRDEHITSPAYKPENVDGFGGEWGMGLRLTGSKNIYVYNIDVSKCWGDGIIIEDFADDPITEKVYFYGESNSYDNRRQGLSVISGKDVYVERLIVKDIYGTKPMRAVDFEPDPVTDKGIDNFRIDYLKGDNCSSVLEFVPRENVFNVSIGTVESVNCRESQIRFANRRYVQKFDDKITIESLSIDYLENTPSILMEQWFNELCPLIDIKHLNIDKLTYTKASTGDDRMKYGYVFLRNRLQSADFGVPTEYFDVGGIHLHDVMVNDFTDTTTYNDFHPFISQNTLAENSDLYSLDNVKIKVNEISALKDFNGVWNYYPMTIKNVDIFGSNNEEDIPAISNTVELTAQNVTAELFTVNRDEFYTIKHYYFNNSDGSIHENLPTTRGFLTSYNSGGEKLLLLKTMTNSPLNQVMEIRRYRSEGSVYLPREDWTYIPLIDIP